MPEIAIEAVSDEASTFHGEVVVPSVVPSEPQVRAAISEVEAAFKPKEAPSGAPVDDPIVKLAEQGIKVLSLEEFTPEKMGIDTKGFIPVGSDLPKAADGKPLFEFINTRYVVYNYDLCGPLGLLQGYLLSFESWVENGNTCHAAIVAATKGCLVLERSLLVQPSGEVMVQLIPRRVRSKDLVCVPLFEAPEGLRKYVTPAWVTEMQFRAGSPPPHRNWVIAVSKEMKTRASLNL